jgi:TPP-dependent pyruvate/acetoin dehydrogenase alpha subunit
LSVNFLGCVPIVGSTIPIGVGAAFGVALQDQRRLSVVYFGDGAAEAGVFYEALNWAVLQHLSVLFVCENNQYSVHTPLALRQPNSRTIRQLAEGIGVRAFGGDGQRVEDVYALTGRAIAHMRAGAGPALIEFQTYRWLQHCGPLPDLQLGYRPEGEFEAWAARCPVVLQRDLLLRDGVLNAGMIDAMEKEIAAVIDDAIAFAKKSPYPSRDELFADVYA